MPTVTHKTYTHFPRYDYLLRSHKGITDYELKLSQEVTISPRMRAFSYNLAFQGSHRYSVMDLQYQAAWLPGTRLELMIVVHCGYS